MTNKYEKQIGVILAQLACKDITLHQAAILAQEQLNLQKLDAYKAGMTEAAEIASQTITNSDSDLFSVEEQIEKKILSARDKKEAI